MKRIISLIFLALAVTATHTPSAQAMGKPRVAPPSAPTPVPVPTPLPVPVRPTSETTIQGPTFTRVDTYPTMTEAWRDPDGRVWAYNFKEGMDRYNEATQFCASYGMRLPTEQEFDRLRSEMGYGTPAGYSPQAFINYVQVNYPNGGQNYFWTSTLVDTCGATVFRTESGFTYRGATDGGQTYGVICVSQ